MDYSSFKKNEFKKKKGLKIPEGVNNYGMKVVKHEKEEKIRDK